MSCDFPALAPGGNDCGVHGSCNTNVSLCVCEDGWSGVGDFALDSQDCDLHLLSIRALWGICLAVHVLSLLQGLNYLHKMFFVTGTYRRNTVTFVLIMLGFSISFVILACLKLFSNEIPAIGDDVVTTIVFCIGAMLFWTGSIEFIHRLGTLYSAQAQRLGSRTNVIKLPRVVLQINIFVFSLMPCLCLFDAENCSIYARIHYVSIAPAMIGLGLYWNKRFAGQLIVDLESAHGVQVHIKGKNMDTESDPIGSLLRRMKTFYKTIRDQALQNIVLALFMAGWSFLLRKASYQLAFAWLSAAIVSLYSVRVVCNNEDQASKQSRSNNKLSKNKLSRQTSLDTETKDVSSEL